MCFKQKLIFYSWIISNFHSFTYINELLIKLIFIIDNLVYSNNCDDMPNSTSPEYVYFVLTNLYRFSDMIALQYDMLSWCLILP